MVKETLSRAQQLATEFEAVNDGILEVVANASPEQWQRVTESERWPAGVVAHHVAEVQRFLTEVIAGLTDVGAPPVELRGADVDANNARHAAEFANVSQKETLDSLRANGAALAALIRSLDEDQLARVTLNFDGQRLTAEQVVAFAMIAHFREHLRSLQQVLAS
jgi:uncharacterized damage-inducible protein DinB